MRLTAAIACAIVIACCGLPRSSAAADDVALCRSPDGDVAAAACSRAITSGKFQGSALAVLFNNRGAAYYNEADYDRAIADYTQAIRLDPREAMAHNGRGNCYVNKGDYDAALADYNDAIRIDPKLGFAYSGRGSAHEAKGDHDKAIADYNEAIRLNPKNAPAFNGRGNAYYAKAEYDRAIADYSDAIHLDPKLAFAYSGRGSSYYGKGQHDRAIADFSEAIRLNPKLSTAYIGRGSAFDAKGDDDQAIADFSEAIRLDPKSALAYGGRGSSYMHKGDLDRAATDLDDAIRLAPKIAKFYNERGTVWIVKGDFDRALAELDHAIALDSGPGVFWSNRGYVFLQKEEFDRAIADLDEAARLSPSYPLTFGIRGQAWLKKGDLDRALANFDQEIALNSKIAGGYTGRGSVWQAKGDFDRAIAEYSRGISLDPTLASVFTYRGLAYEAKGDNERARADFERSLALPRIRNLGTTGGISMINDSDREQKTARAQLAVLATSPSLPAPPQASGRRVALVIGNGAYTVVNALRNPPNDAHALAASLRGIGFDVTEGIDLDRAAMQRTISDFLHGAAGARIALFFYAGHGVQVDGKNYLLPIDAELEESREPLASMTNVDTILAALDDKIRSNIVILDACRDNPEARPAMALAQASRSVYGRGLARTSDPGAGAVAGAGTLIAFATAPGQVALDGEGANSPFSAALIRHISTPGLEVQQMMTRVRAEVVAATKGRQVPWSDSSLLGEVFLVN